MSRKMKFRNLAAFIFIAFVFASPSLSIDFSQEPTRLGEGQTSTTAFNPDGILLAAAHRTDPDSDIYSKQVVILWDPRTLKQVSILEIENVEYVTFSPDGRLLALGCGDNTIRLWDVAGHNQVGLMQSPRVSCLAFSPDGRMLASPGNGSTINLWDVQTKQHLGTLRGHTQGIHGVVFSPDGKLVVSGGVRGDEAILVWDMATQQQMGELLGPLDETYDLAFSPDGTLLASAGGWYDKAIYLWDTKTWEQVSVLGGHSAHVTSIAFSPNGELLVSTVNWDSTIHFWDIEKQEQVGIFKDHSAMASGEISHVAISSDGKWLACGSDNGVELWKLNLPGAIPRTNAFGPKPYDDTLLMDTWVNLEWIAGDFAVSHDVYLGDNFDQVSDATKDSDIFRGNSIETSFYAGFTGVAYPDGLIPGTTYYWRIDEVNDAEPNSPWKGPVWSFMIHPKIAYHPIPADGADSVDLNVKLSWAAGLDTVLHTVYFGDNFNDVNNATGGLNQVATTYRPGPLEFGKTYYWRVDELTRGRGAEIHKGNIWSFTTEGVAENPSPADGAVNVKPTYILSWDAGIVAASHEVYFGLDADSVTNATKASPEYKLARALGDESYDPGKLTLNTTYYWRIDEVNDTNPDSPWKGEVWSFTTGDFFVIDDFEQYNFNDNRIWYAWYDGVGYGVPDTDPYFSGNGTGAIVGDETTGSFTEETIVHGGYQSMPIEYDNSKQDYAYYSEVEYTLTNQRDWTEEGVTELSLWFHGDTANTAEQLYVAVSNSTGAPVIMVHDDLTAVTIDTWTNWIIPLQDVADQGIILTNVDRIAIGLGTQGNMTIPGGKGKIYIDDIRLYQSREATK
jgi:WD40 repeat protein